MVSWGITLTNILGIIMIHEWEIRWGFARAQEQWFSKFRQVRIETIKGSQSDNQVHQLCHSYA